MKHLKIDLNENPPNFPIAIVVSRFNQDVTRELLNGALAALKDYGIEDIAVVEVPGAVEIPVVVKKLAKKQKYGAIIALGAVIRGETTHYEYVCQLVNDGCLQVMMEYEVPVILGVLTTENHEQAWDRLGGAHGHKGKEAADCAIEMYQVLTNINEI